MFNLSLNIRLRKAGSPTILALVCCVWACSPKVRSFTASPAIMITKDDSVKFNWKVTGQPTLLFYLEDAGDDLNPRAQLLSYKLVARKGEKQDFRIQTLTLLPDTSTYVIKLKTVRSGNTLFALDTLDIQRWGI